LKEDEKVDWKKRIDGRSGGSVLKGRGFVSFIERALEVSQESSGLFESLLDSRVHVMLLKGQDQHK